MALSAAEEALVRELIAENPQLLSLADNEATIISKLGATKKNLSELAAALSLNDTDLAFVRQGSSDKSVALSVLKAFAQSGIDLSLYLPKSGGTMTGLLKFAAGTNIASAATVNLSTATGNTVHITGTTGISAWTMTSGQVMDVIFDGVLTLTHHDTNNNLPSAANITTAAGDRARLFYDGTTVYCLNYTRADGTALVAGVASQGGNAGKYLTTNGSVTSWELPLVGVLAGGVGSTVMAARITTTATTSIRADFGDVVAGSDLRPVGLGSQGTSIGSAAGTSVQFGIPSVTTASLSGTWMCVSTEGYTTTGRITISLWRRIA